MTAAIAAASHQLKQLESRKKLLQAERTSKLSVVVEAKEALDATNAKLQAVEREITALQAKSPVPVVSEHAILRYLQRVKGLDLDAICREIMPDGVAEQIKLLKTCKLPVGNGVYLVVENHVVRTIETQDGKPKPAKKSKHSGIKPAQLRQLQEDGILG